MSDRLAHWKGRLPGPGWRRGFGLDVWRRVYWSALTLGPLLIGASLAITSYFVSLPLVSDGATALCLGSRLIHVAPFVASLAAFTLCDVLAELDVPAERHLGRPLKNLYKGAGK